MTDHGTNIPRQRMTDPGNAGYDYVIAGGGSAGVILAARLSEQRRVRVCLIEAGGPGKSLLLRAPAALIAMIPGRPRINNWAFTTEPQTALNGRRGYQPRGKVLGGSGAINSMLYIRGHRRDYDDWAASGCAGWSWNDVLPYFKRAEGNERGASELHGGTGPLRVCDQRSPRPVSHAFIAACAENDIRRNEDFNGPEQEGAGLYQVTQYWGGVKNGERCSSANAYLHPVMDRPNLTVITRAHVTGIALDGKRAIGVRYRCNGREDVASAAREVILSAGVFGSPQLLLLSGIGPARELRQHGIPIVHELPGVGRNLQDHLDFCLGWKSNDTDLFGLGWRAAVNMFGHIRQWRKDGTGMIATPFVEGGAFVKSDEALERPDLQLHFVIAMVEDHGRKIHRGYGFSCHVCGLRPHSRGEVGLRDRNPLSPPRIDPRFATDERDIALLIKGARLTKRILEAPALARYRREDLYTSSSTTDDQLLGQIRARADSVYHPVGTCRMGIDDMAVVDPHLRVHGIAGLRVIDASVMPTLIGGNTNAPTMMIAEKGADMMAEGASTFSRDRESRSCGIRDGCGVP
jgi:choline dehydrogenase-like flavoprotein